MRRLTATLLLLLPLPAHAQDETAQDPPAQEETDPAMERIAEMAPRSIAVVHCGDLRAGTAFAFGDQGRLATARHVADCPRRLRVETLDGRRADARVLTTGEDHDVAILVADEELGLEPLGIRDHPARIGLEVYAVGFPANADDDGHVAMTATRGVVGQVQPDVIYSDVTVSPGSSGGPLVDAELRLVGVVYATNLTGVSLAVPSRHLVPVSTYADDGGDARFPIRLEAGFQLGVFADSEGALLGPRVEVGAVLNDEWTLRLGLGAYLGASQSFDPEPAGLSRGMSQGSAELGYRFRIELGDGVALTIEPTLGISVGYEERSRTTYAIGLADPMCDPSTQQCAITSTPTTEETDRWLVRPTAGLRFGVADILHIGYQFQLDVEDPGASSHLVTFGLSF